MYNGDLVNKIYPVTKDWIVGEATWANWKDGSAWDAQEYLDETDFMTIPTGGGDFDSSKVVYETEDQDSLWESFDVTELVNSMKSSDRSNGFLFDFGAGDMTAMGRDYHSSEAANQDDRPKLVVEYEPVSIAAQGMKTKSSMVSTSVTSSALSVVVNQAGEYRLNLVDLRGKVISSNMIDGKRSHSLETSTLGAGMYVLAIEGNGIAVTETVVVK